MSELADRPDCPTTASGWAACQLQQVAHVSLGKTPRRNQYRDAGTIRIVKFRDVKDGYVDWSCESKGYVASDPVAARNLKDLKIGDTLITASAHSAGHIGKKLAFVTCLPAECERVCYVGELLAVRPTLPDLMAQKWPFYFFQSEAGQTEIAEAIRGGHLTGGRAQAMRIVLPPLPEQRKIATILSSMDDAIERTQAVIEQVQVVKKGLMQELLTRGLPGRHTKFKQTEIGEAPEEWEVLRLGDLGGNEGRPVLRTGPFGSSLKTEHFRASGTPVLNIQCLGEGEICKEGLFYVDDRKADELSDYRVAEGDLVFSRVADVGRSVVVPKESQGWIISSNLMRISPDPKIVDPHFLMYSIVGSQAVLRQIEGLTAKGGRAVVSSPILKGLAFAIPPLDEQRVIASALEAVEQRIRSEASHADRLAGVKQALMSVLLSGEVRVTPDAEAA